MPFGEELGATVGGRTTGMGYSVADGLRQKFTLKERDIETGLDYFLARYYSSTQGRFTSTDPIIIAPERGIDPQQINLYAYARNNPLRFNDPTGEIINEPTNLDEKYRNRYEDWKKAFLSTKAGQVQWDKYANDKNFTLNITLTDRGSDLKNQGAETGNYAFDKSGTVVGATITLGNNIGGGVAGPSSDYPVQSSLTNADAHTIAAAKIAHEFGHVEDARAQGTIFYQQEMVLDTYRSRQDQLTAQGASPQARGNDPALQRIAQQFQTQFGMTMDQLGNAREIRAERATLPYLRDRYGKDMPSEVKSAIKRFEKEHP